MHVPVPVHVLQCANVAAIRLCGPRYWEYALLCTGNPVQSSVASPGVCSISFPLCSAQRGDNGCVVLWAKRKRAQLPYHEDPQGKCNLLAGALPPVEPPSCLPALYRLRLNWLGKSSRTSDDSILSDESGSGGGDAENEDAVPEGGPSPSDQEQLTSYAKDPSVVLLMSVLSGRPDAGTSRRTSAFGLDPAVLLQLVVEVRASRRRLWSRPSPCALACVGLIT